MLRLNDEETLFANILNDIQNSPANMLVALKKRNETNPADFYANINCLKDIEKIMKPILNDIKLWVKQKSKKEDNFEHNFDTAFKDAFEKSETLNLELQNQLSKESRIIALHYHFNLQNLSNQKMKWKFFEERKSFVPIINKTKNMIFSKTYTITFSDNSTIEFNSLDNETLKDIKVKFEMTMKRLAVNPKPEKKLTFASTVTRKM